MIALNSRAMRSSIEGFLPLRVFVEMAVPNLKESLYTSARPVFLIVSACNLAGSKVSDAPAHALLWINCRRSITLKILTVDYFDLRFLIA